MKKSIKFLALNDSLFIHFLRITIFIVMAWIGGLKVIPYEADGIVPFVANSPLMNYFYTHSNNYVIREDGSRVKEYNLFKNSEGKVVEKNIEWHHSNNTYLFSYLLGAVIFLIGTLVLTGIWFPKVGLLGAVLTVGMAVVTLTFLITTPETFVPNLGGDYETPFYGFPYLSGAGRLVLKDIIMLAAGLVMASDSAKRIMKFSN